MDNYIFSWFFSALSLSLFSFSNSWRARGLDLVLKKGQVLLWNFLIVGFLRFICEKNFQKNYNAAKAHLFFFFLKRKEKEKKNRIHRTMWTQLPKQPIPDNSIWKWHDQPKINVVVYQRSEVTRLLRSRWKLFLGSFQHGGPFGRPVMPISTGEKKSTHKKIHWLWRISAGWVFWKQGKW